jgi:hypothetical protein
MTMKNSFLLFLIWTMLVACTAQNSDQTAAADSPGVESPKNVLLHQLKTTHSVKEWFVPVNIALEGVTAKQAMWNDSSGNHSVGQLAYHLLFWNKQQLLKINGQPEDEFSGNNDETFTNFNEAEWSQVVTGLDSVLTAFENAIQNADETKLKEWYPIIANISAHNAYHTGQIIFVRKLQNSWDPEKGVK